MQEFIILSTLALIVSFIPYLKAPFRSIETYFHELSHGLMAVFTGGKIHRIQLNFDGSGHCSTIGGLRIPTLLAGYTGASAAGFAIYYIGTQIQINQAEDFLYAVLVLFIFTTLMWVRHIPTLICIFLMGCLFYLPLKHELYEYTSIYLKFIGIYVCLSAVRSPLDLIDGQDVGDGAELFKYTLLPEGVWIIAWVAFGSYCMYNIYLLSVYNTSLMKLF